MSAPHPGRQLTATAAVPRTFAGDGVDLNALVGSPDGPVDAVAVLLPGYTGSKEDFAPLLDPLAAAGIEAVALDLPGQNGAPGPAPSSGYTPDAIAAHVVLLAGALRSARPEAPVHLLGHSYGGLVARAAVLAAPAAFDSLVLLDSGPAAIEGGRRQLVEILEPVLAASGVEAVYALSQQIARQDPRFEEPPAALGAFYRARFLATSAANLDGVGRAIRDEPDRVDALAAAGVATLVVCGADDDAWPVPLQEQMAGRLGAAFAVVPHAGHSPAVENPAGLLPVLRDFWLPV